jgi:flagellar P-ring protein FlgI
MVRRALAAATLLLCATVPAVAQTRIKDISTVQGVRPNQLVGYGLVVGLNGTGDTLRNAPFTQQSIQAMLDRMGVNIRNAGARTRNVAAVVVTAELPPFSVRGSRIDVTISSIGDATSLLGGSLVLTPLLAPDNQIFAVAQGPLAVGGVSVIGKAESVVQGVPTVGRIPNGALVERDAPGRLSEDRALKLELRNPDFATAVRVADAINEFAAHRYGRRVAEEEDLRTIRLTRPANISATRFIAEIGELTASTDTPARVVIDERTGTIVIGRNVRISTVAIAHGTLTVKVTESQSVSQPAPFSRGDTIVSPESTVAIEEKGGNAALLRETNLETLVKGLNRMGLKPANIIAVLQAIKSAGALQAELVVQ